MSKPTKIADNHQITQFAEPMVIDKLQKVGNYRLEAVIGKGGMGVVFLGTHLLLNKSFAVKVLASQLAQHSRAKQRFLREIDAAGKVSHPNVVTATDAGISNELPYLVMEYLDGFDLKAYLREKGALEISAACEIATQALAGLACIFQEGLVHRDIKPSNLFLTENGIKILDFGLARLKLNDQLTSKGTTLGTFDYTSPEQIVDASDVDYRSDIYSLGCTLYELLAGRAPFATKQFDNVASKIHAHTNVEPQQLKSIAKHVPDDLATLVHQMLEKSPNARPQSASEISERLESFISGPLSISIDDLELPTTMSLPESETDPILSVGTREIFREDQAPWLRWMTLAIVCVIACMLTYTLYLSISNSGVASNSPTPFVAYTTIEPVYWTNNSVSAEKRRLEDNSIVVENNDISLLSVGKVGQEDVDFLVTCNQKELSKNAGVFFGLKKSKNRRVFTYQTITIVRYSAKEIGVWRSRTTLSKDLPEGENSVEESTELASGAVNTIAISIRNGRLASVSVNRKDLTKELVQIRKEQDYGDAIGSFGLVNDDTRTTFFDIGVNGDYPKLEISPGE